MAPIRTPIRIRHETVIDGKRETILRDETGTYTKSEITNNLRIQADKQKENEAAQKAAVEGGHQIG